jgi:hypothetical protein
VINDVNKQGAVDVNATDGLGMTGACHACASAPADDFGLRTALHYWCVRLPCCSQGAAPMGCTVSTTSRPKSASCSSIPRVRALARP